MGEEDLYCMGSFHELTYIGNSLEGPRAHLRLVCTLVLHEVVMAVLSTPLSSSAMHIDVFLHTGH